MTVKVSSKGEWQPTNNWLNKIKNLNSIVYPLMEYSGEKGVELLRQTTPVKTGLAAGSWGYVIVDNSHGANVEWHNYDIEGGYNVIKLLHYGHGTRGGTYVAGRNILGVVDSVIDDFEDKLQKEVRT
jgi:hypothetical protein